MKKTFCIILLAVVLLMLLPMVASAATTTVKYIDENGVERSHECIIITSQDDFSFENHGWYTITGDVTIKNRIKNNAGAKESAAHLILPDGCTLHAKCGIENADKHALIIFGQSGGTGTLLADASSVDGNAGIGGYSFGKGGEITINGGTVIAKGGDSAAGIGGGDDENGGTVVINGGTVNATGGDCAAGIGGGYEGRGGTIVINGGAVTATGGSLAAGIGGGYNGNGGFVTINDGTVVAQGGKFGAGIGGEISVANLSINGGIVTIISGTNLSSGQRKKSVSVANFAIKDGLFVFAGFSEETVAPSDTEGVRDSYYAYIAPRTTYTVFHLWQKTDASGYEQHETELLYGCPGFKTEAKAKSYDALTSQSFEQKEITADGKTIVEIKYNREYKSITFDTHGICAAPERLVALYGAAVTVAPETLSAPGFTFKGWFEDIECTQKFTVPQTITMPSHDITLYAAWTAKLPLPETGDSTSLALLLTLLIAGVESILLISYKARKRR